ncbi:MAG: hypothetical protein WBP79_02975 [Candidatus Acidiferrales bacterium]
MKKLSRCLLGLCLVVAFSFTVAAQDKSQGTASPRNVLQITREYTKPGKAGMVHDKAESAFVQAMTRAKWPTRYLGMTSLSGKQRALFLTWYASFDAWEKDTIATAKNAELSAGLERASVADGELLTEVDQGVFVFNEEMSLRPMADISHMRYMELSAYHVRPGHGEEWREVVKMVKAAYEKGVPAAHWGVYWQKYGGDGDTYLVLTARKTLAEVDGGFEEGKQFEAVMGADGMKKLNEMYGASVESSTHQLFSFNPHMSYVADEWIKADPDFWKPKAAAAPAAKPAKEAAKAKP